MQQHKTSSFAEILRRERKALGLSQAMFAERFEPPIALDTVSRWESGKTLPDAHNTQQLCRIFKKTPAELGLNSDDDNEVILWNIPARNPRFIGRQQLIEKIHNGFNSSKSEIPFHAQVLYSLNGMGKTQIAIEYVHTYMHQYQVVLWFNAMTEKDIRLHLVKLAEHLQLPEKDASDQNMVITAMKRWLTSQRSWLLVLDHISDTEQVNDFLPENGISNGHILLTTLRPSLGIVAHFIPVEKMSLDEACTLLLSRRQATDEPLKDSESQAVQEIITILDGLPLAIEQVSAYIDQVRCSFSKYLQMYRTQHKELLQEGGLPDYPKTVATSWSLSFRKIEEANPVAADLLRLCSFLSPDAIPEEIIIEGLFSHEDKHTEATFKQVQFNRVVKDVLPYSLLQRDQEKGTLNIHRLVQTVLIDNMDKDAQQYWAQRVVLAVNEVFPNVEFANWHLCLRYLPQVQICAELIEQYNLTFVEAARLLEQAGRYLTEIAQYDQAELFLSQALVLREQTQGPEHPDKATTLTYLARLHYKRGKYTQAELLYLEARAIRKRVRGEEDVGAAQSLNALALVYYNQGNYKKAEKFYLKAWDIWEKRLGYDYPDAASTFNNLAWLYYNQGRYQEAEEAYQRALEIWERTQGLNHPDAATSYNGLAVLARSRGRYQQAEYYFKNALVIREETLGSEHPDVATSLNDMAWFWRTQGKYELAKEYYDRVLSIRNRVLGEHHPHAATMRNDLAILAMDLGNYEEAEPKLLEVYKTHLQTLGPKHPRVATNCNNLGWLYYNMGLYSQAEHYHRQAFTIREQVLGKNHPHTARSWNALGAIYHIQGDYRQAEACYEQAIQICLNTIGPYCPLYATFLNNQALLYVDQGKYPEAEKGYKQALHIRQELSQQEHPRVAQVLHNIAVLHMTQGKYDQKVRQAYYTKVESQYLEVLKIRLHIFGNEHPEVAQSLHDLAEFYILLERHTDAFQYFSRALRIRKKLFRPEHPAIVQSLGGLALLYHAQKKYEEAEWRYMEALDMREKALGPKHPEVAQSFHNLALLYFDRDQYARAEQYLLRALEIKDEILNPCHPSMKDTLATLGHLYQYMGLNEEANLYFLRLRDCQGREFEQ